MITISGHSDDIVSICGLPTGDDEVSEGTRFVIGEAEAKEGANAYGIKVRMQYVAGGVWAATIEPVDEDAECPWPVSIKIKGYTAIVEIDCPKETPVSWKRVKTKDS